MIRRVGLQLVAPALALVVAVVVSTVLLQATGNGPGRVFSVILTKGLNRVYVVDTINRAAPYYISAVAVAIGFKMNLFNIGVEGQYRLAALVAGWAGASFALPGPLHVVAIMAVAVVVGATWAAIPAVLKATRGVSEVISSIMLNAIAIGVGAYLLGRYFREPAGRSPVVGTRPLARSGRFPALNGVLDHLGVHLPAANRLQSYLFVALVVGLVYQVVLWRSRFGFDLRATGSNPEAAAASGVDAKRMIVVAMVFSGSVAGLVGLNNIMGEAGRYTDVSVVSGLGFTGIAVALLGRNHPVGIAFGALLWGFMDAVQTPLSNADLPKQITAILQGVTVLSVVMAYEVVRRVRARQEAASFRDAVDDHTSSGTAPEQAVPT